MKGPLADTPPRSRVHSSSARTVSRTNSWPNAGRIIARTPDHLRNGIPRTRARPPPSPGHASTSQSGSTAKPGDGSDRVHRHSNVRTLIRYPYKMLILITCSLSTQLVYKTYLGHVHDVYILIGSSTIGISVSISNVNRRFPTSSSFQITVNIPGLDPVSLDSYR